MSYYVPSSDVEEDSRDSNYPSATSDFTQTLAVVNEREELVCEVPLTDINGLQVANVILPHGNQSNVAITTHSNTNGQGRNTATIIESLSNISLGTEVHVESNSIDTPLDMSTNFVGTEVHVESNSIDTPLDMSTNFVESDQQPDIIDFPPQYYSDDEGASSVPLPQESLPANDAASNAQPTVATTASQTIDEDSNGPLADNEAEMASITDSSDDDDHGTQLPSDSDSQSNSDDDSDNPGYVTEYHNLAPLAPEQPGIPLHNYAADSEHPDDLGLGWEWLEHDTGPSNGPFLGEASLQMPNPGREPIDFVDAMFDTAMWRTITDQTNEYAAKVRRTGQGILLVSTLYM